MKKIISFSLWGTQEKYTNGAIENAKLASQLFPDWICRYYISERTAQLLPEIIEQLFGFDNTEIKIMPDTSDWNGLFWRFLPCSDMEVEYMLSRDCDSRLSRREQSAVRQWLHSGKSFHIIRDHPWHNLEIMGGLWGAKTEVLRNMKQLINQYSGSRGIYDDDQKFLATIIYPQIASDCFIHDEFFGGSKIPMRRKNLEFIGQVLDPHNIRTLEHENALREALRKISIYYRSKENLKKIFGR